MSISVYSVVASIVFFNIALIVAFIMRRSSVFLARQSISFLGLMVLLGVIRLLTPIDFDGNIIVGSKYIVPGMERFLARTVAGTISVASLLLIIWFLGTIILVVRDIAKQVRFVRASRGYPSSDRRDLFDLAGEYGSDFGLLVSASVSRPYVTGLFRPVIYLPDIELPEEQWRTILRHEIQHIRSHDEWKKLFFLAIQALFWWNPLAHISLKEIDTLIELQCDAKVTSCMSVREVDAYLDTLISLKNHTANTFAPIGASCLVWDQQQLAARFEALQNAGRGNKRRKHIIAYLLLISVFVLSYFVILQPQRFPSEADMMDGIPYTEGLEPIEFSTYSSEPTIRKVDGEYHLFDDDVDMGVLDEANLSIEPFNTFPILEDDP